MMTRIGKRKLHYLIKPSLDKMGIKCGRDKLFAILKFEGMLIKKKRNYMRTTNSYHRFYKYPNLIKDVEINRSEQVWASDITYIRTSEGFLYLSLITDVYSKKVVGYQLSDNLKTINCISALKEAIKKRQYPDRSLIHHSDRGVQYASYDYTEQLQQIGAQISMSSVSNPYDNAKAESFFKTLKQEEVYLKEYESFADAEANLAVFIEQVYNTKRLHSSLGYLPPAEFEATYISVPGS